MVKPFVPNDYFAQKAKKAGLLARSAFKLKAINEKFGVLKPGQFVLDLGAAPGSWLQVASGIAGSNGQVVGVDLSPMKFSAPNLKTFEMDILDPGIIKTLEPFGQFDVIISDLAPRTTGIKIRDQALSLELDQQVINLAQNLLRPGGDVIIKIFQSPDTKRFVRQIKTMFKTVHTYKPPASRDRSFETYIIGLWYRYGESNPDSQLEKLVS